MGQNEKARQQASFVQKFHDKRHHAKLRTVSF
jgi:hypothetical protein